MPNKSAFVAEGGGFSLPGENKPFQQDRWMFANLQSGTVGALADGMSKYPKSEKVAEIACSTFVDVVARKLGEKLLPKEAVIAGADAAWRTCAEMSDREDGAKAVFAGVFLGNDGTAVVTSVGDARIWVLGPKVWRNQTPKEDSDSTGVTMAMGDSEKDAPDWEDRTWTSKEPIQAVLAASDGFYKTIDEDRGGRPRDDKTVDLLNERLRKVENVLPFALARDQVHAAYRLGLDDDCTVLALVRRPRQAAGVDLPGPILAAVALLVAALIGFAGGVKIGPRLIRDLPPKPATAAFVDRGSEAAPAAVEPTRAPPPAPAPTPAPAVATTRAETVPAQRPVEPVVPVAAAAPADGLTDWTVVLADQLRQCGAKAVNPIEVLPVPMKVTNEPATSLIYLREDWTAGVKAIVAAKEPATGSWMLVDPVGTSRNVKLQYFGTPECSRIPFPSSADLKSMIQRNRFSLRCSANASEWTCSNVSGQ